ncbi:MAG: class I tRNA ligase family protein, partial [Ktedonobacteraceae bacterium]|nr:class I tRNA ligase family protein [Ktedonobacteraceae bacterium]
TGKAPFSRFWMHSGMLFQDGEKMSKSLGNLTLVSNLLKEHSPDTIRLVLQSHHYRYPWECTQADLRDAAAAITLFERVRALVGRNAEGEDLELRQRFERYMENDLNSPDTIQLLRQAAESAITREDLNSGAEILRLTGVLGLCV